MDDYDISRDSLKMPAEWREELQESMEDEEPESIEELLDSQEEPPESEGCLAAALGWGLFIGGALVCGFFGAFACGLVGLCLFDLLGDYLARLSGLTAFSNPAVPLLGFIAGGVLGIIVFAILGGVYCRKLALWRITPTRPDLETTTTDEYTPTNEYTSMDE